MIEKNKKFDLDDRLIDFAVRIVRLAESFPKTKAGNHIAGQLIRCGTSPAANYGEAQDAESRADFTHKMKVVLKELRETNTCPLVTARSQIIKPSAKLEPLIDENNQLISIFVAGVKTAKQNDKT
jgi:four helix bundle protein